jgi:uncharacterized RDD family membrane protein YckC
MTNAVAQEVSYASLGKRALAFFLDSIVWLVLLGQIAANIPADVYEDAPVVVGVIFLGLFSVAFNYFWFAEWKFGKTLGKAIVSIHVTTEDGERLRFGPATVRNIMRLVDVFGIGPIMIGNSERHQRLGDRFAHSIVVRDRQPAPRPAPPPVPRLSNPGHQPTINPQLHANPAIADAGASERQVRRANLPVVLGRERARAEQIAGVILRGRNQSGFRPRPGGRSTSCGRCWRSSA